MSSQPLLSAGCVYEGKCPCTRVSNLRCGHTQLLISPFCQLTIHHPRAENNLVWVDESCFAAHEQASFVIPLCSRLDKDRRQSTPHFKLAYVSEQGRNMPILAVINELVACAKTRNAPKAKTEVGLQVRFLLPYSTRVEWLTNSSDNDDDEAARLESVYEEATRRNNIVRREIDKLSKERRRPLFEIALDMHCLKEQTRRGGSLPSASCPSGLTRTMAQLLQKRREYQELYAQVQAEIDERKEQLKVLHECRERSAFLVASGCIAKSFKRASDASDMKGRSQV